MKGISAVIAVILILMITVALAAMAYVWFTDVFETVTEGAGSAAEGTATTIATSFSIAGATNSTSGDTIEVYVTNTGSADMTIENFVLLVNNKRIETDQSGTLTPGETVTLSNDADTDTYNCGDTVKITYGSLQQVTTIAC